MRRFCAWVLCAAIFCLPLVGCALQKGDYFAPFRGQFKADVSGEWQSIAFEGKLEAAAPDESGARVMTLTFYAPASLCGTVLARDAAGTLTLSAGELSLPLDEHAAQGYGALFALFPIAGEVQSVTRENGNIRLNGMGFSLSFAADGTPLAAENATARVEITAFEGGA